MRGEYDGGVVRHFVQFFDEHGALGAQPVDHKAVVDHLVPDVDRRAEQFQRPFDDADGAIDASTEAAGIGEQDLLHVPQAPCRSGLTSSMWAIMATAPTVMALSAMLKTGQLQRS